MLKDSWTNKKSRFAFSGISKIYSHYIGAKSQRDIKNELAEIPTYTRHKEAKRIKNYNPYYIYSLHEMWQADIMYLPDLAEINDGYIYLLCVLEVFSRKLFIEKMKNKSSETVLKAFKKIHEQINKTPKKLVTDKGREFKCTPFKKYCERNGINLIFAESDTKAPHVERAQRSFQSILYKMMEELQTKRYIDFLDDVLFIFNRRTNRMTGLPPNEAYRKKNEEKVLLKLNKYYDGKNSLRKKPNFKIGQTVRIKEKRQAFARGYNPNFTEEVFKIKNVLTNLPQPRYILESYDGEEEISGRFYEREITLSTHQEFKIEKIIKEKKIGRKKQYFVKWLGFPISQASWVDEKWIKKYQG